MRVRDLMTRHCDSIRPSDTVQAAAALMRDHAVGALPVVDEMARAVGLLTDRDVTVRVVAEGLDPMRVLVKRAMTPQVFACHAGDDLDEAAFEMAAKCVRRLLVVDDNERPVGMLSIDDLARAGRDPTILEAIGETVASEVS